jgi:hypothetical protein
VSDVVVELDGLRYVWTGSRWYRQRDFLTPPGATTQRLQTLLPDDIAVAQPNEEEPVKCPRSLRDTWPDPLAGEWLERYPQLFDADDFRCTRRQPTLHFWEWYAAIHIFERDGAYSLVEKYVYKNHPVKTARLASILSESQLGILKAICHRHKAEPPDLFVYVPETGRFWFAEVKGPTDHQHANQAASHEAIERELGVPVEILQFTLAND